MRTAIVAGALANKHLNGGEAWVRMSWAQGIRQLGWNVHFVEQIDTATCVDARGVPAPFELSANLAFFSRTTSAFGVGQFATLILGDGPRTHGVSYDDLLAMAEKADLLINISGHLRDERLLQRIRRKAYVDLDPGYTQFWHAAGDDGARLAGHDYYFTVGENIGRQDCGVPTSNIRWIPTRQPVVLAHWPVVKASRSDRFTTVASWRGAFGPVEHNGVKFGQKAHQFRRFRELPNRRPYHFEIALDIHDDDAADRSSLRANGWRLVAPTAVAATPESYRGYIQQSSAEFSVAQGVYVETNCGWFSDRTAYYLATGKPVLVQNTGFSQSLPVGEGLIAFATVDEAVEGADRIVGDYERHCRAARRVAEEYFGSTKVLSNFLGRMQLAS